MFNILQTEKIAPQVYSMVISAPFIAGHTKAGNFIILRIHEKGERIPLTIADSDADEGTITLLFQTIGRTTKELGQLKAGDQIRDITGPLGHPTPIRRYGHCVLVGGGIGTATLFPILKELKIKRNRTTVILGARTKNLIVWEDKFRVNSNNLILTTDDGSSGRMGLVTSALREVIDGGKVRIVFAVGPVRMMQAVSELTRPYGIKTLVSLNPVMLEGTGMCGACRVTIDGKTKFACIDGPEFDGHHVDYEEISQRLNFYKDEENESLKKFNKKNCKGKCRSKSKIKN